MLFRAIFDLFKRYRACPSLDSTMSQLPRFTVCRLTAEILCPRLYVNMINVGPRSWPWRRLQAGVRVCGCAGRVGGDVWGVGVGMCVKLHLTHLLNCYRVVA